METNQFVGGIYAILIGKDQNCSWITAQKWDENVLIVIYRFLFIYSSLKSF